MNTPAPLSCAIRIPTLCPVPPDGSPSLGVSAQPILCFKELEVDRVRYDAWKTWVARGVERRAARAAARAAARRRGAR